MNKNNIKRVLLVLSVIPLICCSHIMNSKNDKAVIYNNKMQYETLSVDLNNIYKIDINTRTLETRKEKHRNKVSYDIEEVSTFSIARTKQIEIEQTYIYDFSEDEIKLLAHLIMGEAEGEPLDGKIAVGQVIINRMFKSNKTMKEIVYQIVAGYRQFSCVTDGRINLEPTDECYNAVDLIMLGEKRIDDDITYFNAGYSAWHRNNLIFVTTIGGHDFYKE